MQLVDSINSTPCMLCSFEIAVAAVTAITLPILITASLFGMNVEGVPQYEFWPLVGVLAGICFCLLILLLIVWWVFFRNKSKSKEKNKRIKVPSLFALARNETDRFNADEQRSLAHLPGKSTEFVRKSFDWHPRFIEVSLYGRVYLLQ